jgi:hypothetical protein
LLLALQFDLLSSHLRHRLTHFYNPLQFLDSRIASWLDSCFLCQNLRLERFPQDKSGLTLVADQFLPQFSFHATGLDTRQPEGEQVKAQTLDHLRSTFCLDSSHFLSINPYFPRQKELQQCSRG